MSQSPHAEPYSQIGRLLAVVILLGALAGLAVWYGTASPNDSPTDRLPTEEEFGPAKADYIGERVAATGTIVQTDPVILEVTYGDDGHATFRLEGYEAPVSEGSYELVTGTLVDESTIVLVGSETAQPWESSYMYAVSAIAILWVGGRAIRHWRFDREQLAFVPRTAPQAVPTHRQERRHSSDDTPTRSTTEGDDA